MLKFRLLSKQVVKQPVKILHFQRLVYLKGWPSGTRKWNLLSENRVFA